MDPTGKERVYETVERTTRPELTGVDGVDIISRSMFSNSTLLWSSVVPRTCHAVALIPPEVNSGSSDRATGNRGKRICLVAVYRAPVNR